MSPPRWPRYAVTYAREIFHKHQKVECLRRKKSRKPGSFYVSPRLFQQSVNMFTSNTEPSDKFSYQLNLN